MKKYFSKKERLKKIARAHALFSISFFGFYLLFSLIYSPEFLLRDIRDKFQALADDTITITATVLSSPIKPIVSGYAKCTNRNLTVHIDWPSDQNSESFSLERNGSALVTGITNSEFQDNSVSTGKIYEYIVIARSSMGSGIASSEILRIVTPQNCEEEEEEEEIDDEKDKEPSIEILSFENKSVSSYSNIPSTSSKKPIFSGITNIPNAIIIIQINSSPIISTQIEANENGYWHWKTPHDLPFGIYSFSIIAKDPSDKNISTSNSFIFEIFNPEKKIEETKNELEKTSEQPENIPMAIPLDFSLSIENQTVFQEHELETYIDIEILDILYENEHAEIRYAILDENNNEVFSFLTQNILRDGKYIPQNFLLPKYLKEGKYKLLAEINFSGLSLSRQKNFTILPAPFFKLGGGIVISQTDFLSKMGTISLFLIFFLFFWLLAFYREYWLYLHSIRYITEKHLAKIGLFGIIKRKGVLK